jgi:DNA-binding Lrp family transcriptional regulator
MNLGFVLIKAEPGYEHKVYNELTKVEEIIQIHPLSEEFDFIAKVEAENYERFENIVKSKIKSINGILNIKTLTESKFY